MNFRLLLITGLVMTGANTLHAQAGAVLTADPVLPPEKQVVNEALLRVRDAMQQVVAAGSRISRDRNQASDASLTSRAQLLSNNCKVAILTSDSAQVAVARGGFPSPDPRNNRARMEKALGELKTKLTWCEGEFGRLSQPEHATELRGYGIGRAAQMDAAGLKFRQELESYIKNGLGGIYRPNTRGAGTVANPPKRQ